MKTGICVALVGSALVLGSCMTGGIDSDVDDVSSSSSASRLDCQECSGSGDPHERSCNTWDNYPDSCLCCHQAEFDEMAQALHYKWTGDAPDMVNQPGIQQGKLTNAVNSYCINVKGNWGVCGKCHVGRGLPPGPDTAATENIDCLVCHNEDYAKARVRCSEKTPCIDPFDTDGSLGPPEGTSGDDLESFVTEVSAPTRSACLKCHAFAGGGDGVKRGDLSWAQTHNIDPEFDVHMNENGPNLACQDCHTFVNHRVTGKGSDLRVTDYAAEVSCSGCHEGKDTECGHGNPHVNRHVARVSCQACHVDAYAKVPTEVYRDWRFQHADPEEDPEPADEPPDGEAGHPYSVKEPYPDDGEGLPPTYRFWNRLSDNYLLHDDASLTYDAELGTYPTSRPVGDIHDGKLYPFKYKTAVQPMVSDRRNTYPTLIALDTWYFLTQAMNADEATKLGMLNMNEDPESQTLSRRTRYEWVTTDTLGLLNHGIPPASEAVCGQCHAPLDPGCDSMLDELGYQLKGPKSQVCGQCHQGGKPLKASNIVVHRHINKGPQGIGCGFCHSFERPERGLCSPCDPCAEQLVDCTPYDHSDICD